MNRLFVKIWLWFWVAMLLLGGSLFLVERQFSDGFRGERLAALVQALGTAGLTVRRQQGPAAFEAWRETLEAQLGGRLYLLGPGGRDLGDRRLPGDLARDLDPESVGAGRHRFGHRRHGLVSRFEGAGGPYTAVALQPRGGLGSLPGWARVAVAAVVSGMVCLGLALYVARPVRRVRAATRRLAEGDLDVRVGPAMGRRRDEMAVLGHDFDAMAARLRELLESQQRLLRDVSHELRSPLARLRVALELARRAPAETAALDRIEREAERLDALVGQVLTLARLDAGRVSPRRDALDLAGLLEEVCADAQFEASARGVTVERRISGQAPVQGDAALLRSALENIIRNAVHHTAVGSAVQVSLEATPAGLRLGVRDHGPGVPAADLPRLFEPFFRVQQARERATGGHGLGLAIARRALTVHGGELTARNHPDGGLELLVRLPGAGEPDHRRARVS